MHMGRTIVYDAVLAASSGGSDANSTKPQKKKMRKSRDQRVSLSWDWSRKFFSLRHKDWNVEPKR